MNKITIDEIVDVFTFSDQVLKMQKIKELVFQQRDYSFKPYETKYSFDQTIQKHVEKRCPKRKGFTGEHIFDLVDRAMYKLNNY